MSTNNILHLIGLGLIGTAAVNQFGWLNGLAIVFAVFILMPYHPRS
jgi:hypothetical protein